ncbi:unnamed protein product [Symbiodinium natans]|uniref:Uncharacterized protein n=1 Tax=Symbiodinium natans TaxID=878477 RepID=A0A812JJV7_9DINO|nr:unnamed protein product [Symbiodinium natans]
MRLRLVKDDLDAIEDGILNKLRHQRQQARPGEKSNRWTLLELSRMHGHVTILCDVYTGMIAADGVVFWQRPPCYQGRAASLPRGLGGAGGSPVLCRGLKSTQCLKLREEPLS